MAVNSSLLTLVMARSVVDRISGVNGVASYDLRTLAGIHALTGMGRVCTLAALTELMGLGTTAHTHRSVDRLRAKHLVLVPTLPKHKVKTVLSPAGLRLVGLLEREERDARRRAQSVTAGRKKRAYVKSGKFIGKAAKQAERARGGNAKKEE